MTEKQLEKQNAVVNALGKKGFVVNHCSQDTVFMSKRVKSYSTRYAEVDENGLVNGQELSLKRFSEFFGL